MKANIIFNAVELRQLILDSEIVKEFAKQSKLLNKFVTVGNALGNPNIVCIIN